MSKNNNVNLNTAFKTKQDEFYTRLSDIEGELSHYRSFFKGKTVLCNCDDPYESNFVKYFAMNFNSLGLKKLIATCYATSPVMYTQISFFGTEEVIGAADNGSKPYIIEVSEVTDENGDGAVDLSDFELILKKNKPKLLKGNGDFRSDECIELLQQADVVVTNPPFSLFREYIAQLIEYKKSFLIIGSQNAVTYKEIFPLFKENKVWFGFHSGHTLFSVPDTYTVPKHFDLSDKNRVRGAGYKFDENGKLWRDLGNICWYTNIEHSKRHESLILYKKYNEQDYPTYTNYDAINVNKVADIPCDYYGIIGVPITFLDKYNPEQFEILGITQRNDDPYKIKKYTTDEYKNANDLNARACLLVDGKPKSIYARILIKKRGNDNGDKA